MTMINKKRVAIITEIMSPYRLVLFNELNKAGDVDLKVFFLSKTEKRRSWVIDDSALDFAYHVSSAPMLQVGPRAMLE